MIEKAGEFLSSIVSWLFPPERPLLDEDEWRELWERERAKQRAIDRMEAKRRVRELVYSQVFTSGRSHEEALRAAEKAEVEYEPWRSTQ